MNRTNLSKIFSSGLSLALAVTSMPISASAAGPMAAAPAFVSRLTPPEQFGYVASSFAPNNEEKPRLIIISDLHGHLEVQHNIMGMLDHFVNNLTSNKSASSQGHVPIFVEGGWESHLEQPLKAVKNANTRLQLSKYLLEKAELSAAQTYSEQHLNDARITLTGVENKAEYEMNRQRFAQTYPERKKLLEAISREEKTLKTVREGVNGSAYQKLYSLRQDYDKGILSQTRYAKALLSFARRYGINTQDVETLRTMESGSAASVEMALVRVHQAVSQVAAKARPSTSFLRPSLPKEDQIRKNVGYIDSRLDLLKRLIGNQLTPEEVPFALSKMAELVQVAEILLKDSKEKVDIRQTVQKSLDFYPFAFMRDESLAENSIAALTKDDQHVPTGILVAGGFHAEGIAKYLQSQKIAYLMVSPSITRDITAEEQLNYIRRICNDHVTPMEVSYDLSHPSSLASAAPVAAPVTNLANTATPGVTNAADLGRTIENPQSGTPGKNVKDWGLIGFNPGMFAGDPARVTHNELDAAFIAGEKILAQQGTAGAEASPALTQLAQANDIQFDAIAQKAVKLEYMPETGTYVPSEVNPGTTRIADKVNQLMSANGNAGKESHILHVQAVRGTIDTTFKSNPNQKEFQVYSRQATIVGDQGAESTILLGEAIYDQAASGKTAVSDEEIRKESVVTHELEHRRGGANEFLTTLGGFAAQAVLTDAAKQGVDPTKVTHQTSLETVKQVLKAISGDKTEAGALAGNILDALVTNAPATDKLYTAPELSKLFAGLVSEPEISDATVQKYAQEFGLPEQTVRLAMQNDFEMRVMGYPEPPNAPSGFKGKLKKVATTLGLSAENA